MLPPLDDILKSPVFSTLDRRFARFIEERDDNPATPVAAALVSYQLGRGHVYLDLSREPRWEEPPSPLSSWPATEDWRKLLNPSKTVGDPGTHYPLILTESSKLYLHRYWTYERMLAENLLERSAPPDASLPARLEERLDLLLGDAPEQKEAARMALSRRFSLISGGPGTGKTSTVLKILILLIEQQSDRHPVIYLAAPTGKAAARLRESMLNGIEATACSESVRASLPDSASTIHRLLKPIPGSVFFRHRKDNPLPADVVVVDEASMVDLPLMAKLFDALPLECRVILLGDKDQLASVEAGSVLAGIVEAAEAGAHSAVSLLTKNFRFGNESGIHRICNAVRDGDSASAFQILTDKTTPDLAWQNLPQPERLKEMLRPLVIAGHGKRVREKDPLKALESLGRFQILTAVRHGPYGKDTVNALVEEILREEGLVTTRNRNFPGRPLMVTENDYALRLFNGDVGVLLDDDEGKSMAYFRSEDGSIRSVSPMRLPFTESAFAMTVHKSQGSEFDDILLILPNHDIPILTRELIYTAISRARGQTAVWALPEVFKAAVSRRVDRASGLKEFFQK